MTQRTIPANLRRLAELVVETGGSWFRGDGFRRTEDEVMGSGSGTHASAS
jgi:hypothetical protein